LTDSEPQNGREGAGETDSLRRTDAEHPDERPKAEVAGSGEADGFESCGVNVAVFSCV
jgi:hypothetical protein